MNRWRIATVLLAAALLLTLALPGALAAPGSADATTATTPSTSSGTATTAPQPAERSSQHNGDYLPAHNFKLELDGVISGGFKEISGLESEVEIVEYRDGSDPVTHKRPGKVKYSNIVLKRGLSADKSLAQWYQQGAVKRKSVSIIFLNDKDEEAARYNFFEAWPCRYAVYADADGYLIEEIEFVVEKVERA